MKKAVTVAMLATPMAIAACAGHDAGPSPTLPSAPPQALAKVASGNFQAPTDVVASPDGSTFYFAAYDSNHTAAIFSTSSKPNSTATEIASGGKLDLPIGLVLACDGSEIYVADIGTGDATNGEPVSEAGAILTMAASGGQVTNLHVSNLDRPQGLAMAPDCQHLYVTGQTKDGLPALFTVPVTGGAAQIVWMGAPLVSPTGLHVDAKGTAWVMDHLAVGQAGEGVLFQIPADGTAANEVASNIHMGTPGGVSLTAGGGTAVLGTVNARGQSELTTIDLASGDVGHIAAPAMMEPSGLRTAREAGVFAVADTEGNAIYRAE
jgi:DNA-binding beta-propeller fold protein YncE